jgi:hypothetical protein
VRRFETQIQAAAHYCEAPDFAFFPPSSSSQRLLSWGARDMFAAPNKKGMEVVFHFLFSALSPAQAREEFK